MKKKVEVVCALIEKDNMYFCCQRAPGGEVGLKWEFPGGKIEAGESGETAIVREIQEELNTLIKVKSYVTTIEHEYETFEIKMHAYLCEVVEGELTLNEHIDSKWVLRKDLSSIDFAMADIKIINEL